MFSDSNGNKLEIQNRKKSRATSSIWRLNKTLLNNLWAKQENKREIRTYFDPNEKKGKTKCIKI